MGSMISHHYKSRNPGIPKKHKHYGKQKTHLIQILYILASLLWLMLISLVGYLSFETNFFGYVILSLPLFIFASAFYYTNQLCVDLEEQMFVNDYFTIAMLIGLPILVWMSDDYGGDKRQFIQSVMIAIVLTLLSSLDLWLSRKWITIWKHTKSILQVIAIILLVMALYIYYIRKTTLHFARY